MTETFERVATAIRLALHEDYSHLSERDMSREIARAAIEAMRELPEEPGPRYIAGEYSRRNHAAMIDDALNVPL
jgi:hypothetical protein